MKGLAYIAPGIYGKDDGRKRQLHLDVPNILARNHWTDTPAHRRRAIRYAFDELRRQGLQIGGFVLIARQAGVHVQ